MKKREKKKKMKKRRGEKRRRKGERELERERKLTLHRLDRWNERLMPFFESPVRVQTAVTCYRWKVNIRINKMHCLPFGILFPFTACQTFTFYCVHSRKQSWTTTVIFNFGQVVWMLIDLWSIANTTGHRLYAYSEEQRKVKEPSLTGWPYLFFHLFPSSGPGKK